MTKMLVIVLVLTVHVEAKIKRSQSARRHFAQVNPCPATGKRALPCPGYVIDHVIPLCAGGPDNPSNMQWQTVKESKIKDREEVRQCRKMIRSSVND